jgi:hypothetical protein
VAESEQVQQDQPQDETKPDVLDGLMVPEAPKEEPKPATEEPAKVEQVTTEAAGDAESGQAEEAKPETETAKPAPGTADKALQALQQKHGALERKYEDLMAKLEAGTASKQEVQQAKRKLDEIGEALTNYDPLDEAQSKRVIGGAVEALKETDGEVQQLKQVVHHLAQTVEQQKAEKAWDAVTSQYPKVDVKSVWEKALEDAKPYANFGAEAYQTRANELFHERAGNAAKSVAAKNPPAPAAAKPTANKPVTPITPGATRTTIQSGVRTTVTEVADPYQQTLALLDKCIKD